MLEGGIYGLWFAASQNGEPENGSGLAVLREGKVLGSDPLGAVFTGTYEFDAARQLNKVRLRLDVPADGVLVTGFSAGPSGATLDIVGAFAGTSAETPAFIRLPARRSVCRSGIWGRFPTRMSRSTAGDD
jgi:hypothetical protein